MVYTVDLVLKYALQAPALYLDGYADSDWAGDQTAKSTSAIQEYLGMHLIESAVGQQSVVALSSGESEYYGMVKGTAHGLETVLLEKSEYFGGSTARSGGGVAGPAAVHAAYLRGVAWRARGAGSDRPWAAPRIARSRVLGPLRNGPYGQGALMPTGGPCDRAAGARGANIL